eukprot:1129717-Pelagomonas_calceolata.AAC.4
MTFPLRYAHAHACALRTSVHALHEGACFAEGVMKTWSISHPADCYYSFWSSLHAPLDTLRATALLIPCMLPSLSAPPAAHSLPVVRASLRTLLDVGMGV